MVKMAELEQLRALAEAMYLGSEIVLRAQSLQNLKDLSELKLPGIKIECNLDEVVINMLTQEKNIDRLFRC